MSTDTLEFTLNCALRIIFLPLFIFLYKAEAETKALEPTKQEIAGVLQKRNELAAALKQYDLPSIAQDKRICERYVYHLLVIHCNFSFHVPIH